MSKFFALLALQLLLAHAGNAAAQTSSEQRRAWNVEVPPLRVVGNVYYVGASGVSAFLITTKAGSILLDGGLPETAPLIARNITTLGFRLEDVKLLLNSHAHFDHAGGLAELKRRSGARLLVSHGDAPAVRRGGPDQPAVEVDKEIKDGERVELGGTVLTAHVTPGHTRGCTTWSMTANDDAQQRRVVFHCSTSVVDRLLDNAAYPEIVLDYERSFRTLRELPCDVFLAPHPSFFGLDEKRQKLQPGAPNPFIDPDELRRFVDKSEQDFRKALEAQRSQRAAPKPNKPKPAPPKPAAPQRAPHPAAS